MSSKKKAPAKKKVEAQEPVVNMNRIRELRERGVALTQEEVGKIMGYDNTTISRHENNSRSLSPEDIQRYAKLFKVETWELVLSPREFKGEAAVGQPTA